MKRYAVTGLDWKARTIWTMYVDAINETDAKLVTSRLMRCTPDSTVQLLLAVDMRVVEETNGRG